MVTLDIMERAVHVGIVRILQVILTCISFSLVASLGHSTFSFWTFCMFIWCFCFGVTLLIFLLEFTSVSAKLSISWDNFMIAFAMLAAIMLLAASTIYYIYFVYSENYKGIGATVTSCVACILYGIEVLLTRARSGEIRGFPSTVLYFLKVLETCVACIIFLCLDDRHFSKFPGLQWCVAVYCICFIFSAVVIVFAIFRIRSLFPALFDKVLTICNMLAVLMYITAVIIWPLYSFQNEPWTSHCGARGRFEGRCMNLVVFFMTFINLVVYIVDAIHSTRLVLDSPVSTEG